jgi:lipid-binding SYLF domain-containing protein
VSVAAGPLGAGAIVDSGIEAAPVLSYVKSKGLYGGAQVDGKLPYGLDLFVACSYLAMYEQGTSSSKEAMRTNGSMVVP